MQVMVIITGLGFWAITTANKTDTVVTAMIGVNSRLDRIFEKLDAIPVVQERLTQVQSQLADAKGAYVSLEARLRGLESNVSAVHDEATKPRRN